MVKELVENAIDAGQPPSRSRSRRAAQRSCALRITAAEFRRKVPLAFLRHSTSKIKSVEDLLCIHSLGFRGEALSSIAAVSQVELITKTYSDLTGTRYVIEGSREMSNDEIGAPDGTTFIVRNLFSQYAGTEKVFKNRADGGKLYQ